MGDNKLGDCWFISAIGTVCGIPHLIERLCVARDEMVGGKVHQLCRYEDLLVIVIQSCGFSVYGFIFFRDGRWESVIVDE